MTERQPGSYAISCFHPPVTTLWWKLDRLEAEEGDRFRRAAEDGLHDRGAIDRMVQGLADTDVAGHRVDVVQPQDAGLEATVNRSRW